MVQVSQNVAAPVISQKEQRVIELAKKLKDVRARKGSFPIPGRLKQLKDFFQAAYNYFESAAKTAAVVPPASDWLLDNYYILEQALRLIEEDLPVDYYGRLPKTADGRPRIQIISLALGEGAPRLDLEQIRNFIQSFQTVVPLQVGELWALPLLLRLTVLESLADGLAEITKLAWQPVPKPALEKEIQAASDMPEPDADTRVIHSILNLRFIATVEWKDFFEETSVLNQVLSRDPAGVYSESDFETRNLYRGVVEELSRGSSLSEEEVAQQAIELASAAEAARERHAGFYLVAEGRRKLEDRIQFHPTGRGLIVRFLWNHPTLVYIGSIALITAVLLGIVLSFTIRVNASQAQILTVLLLGILPASAIAVQLVNWLVGLIVPPSILPKLELKGGIPPEYRTMVVIPALLGTENDVTFLTRQIENHFVANHDPNVLFALLTDYADAPEKIMPQDAQVLAQATTRIKELNAKYGTPEYQPFFLFHRERVWNAGEECWLGWERKRGKLEEFNELLRGSQETTYTTQIGNLPLLGSIRYVITLDADTLLPRESARRLVGTLAHILNRAVLDPQTDTVKAGYTILQPRCRCDRLSSTNRSLRGPMPAMPSSTCTAGRSPMSIRISSRRGILSARGFTTSTLFAAASTTKCRKIICSVMISLSPCRGAAELVTDVTLFEDYPPHYLAYTDRLHRWVRGDWQLLPWLGRWVPHRAKGWARNTLAPIDRWRIFDNLRRSLVPISVLALLVTGWLYLAGPKLFWTLIALFPYIFPILTSLLSELRRDLAEEYPKFESRSIRLTALRSFFEVLFLPHEAFVNLDAIATTFNRLFVTHKRMLQWMTAAHSVKLFGKTLRVKSAWQAMVLAPLFAVALGVIILLREPNAMVIAGLFLIGWVFSPTIAALIGIPDRQPVVELSPAQEKKLRLLARSTWLYFEHFVAPEDRWLPPDHYQENPLGRIQHQTSPTNIGLMLLSTLAAHDMGYMGAQEFSLRLRDSFDTLESMERLRGHFLNWYDTRSLAPLLPRYVSTVDSGNLAACLLALKHGCLDRQDAPVVQWQGLVDTIDMLLLVLERSGIDKTAIEFKKMIQSLRDQAEALARPEAFSPERLMKLLDDGQEDFEDLLWKSIQGAEDEPSSRSLQELSTWVQRVRYQLRHIRTNIQVLAPWPIALAEAPKIESKPGSEAELDATWTQILNTFSLHPKLGEIPQICEQANHLIGTLLDLMGYGNTDAFNWLEVLSYDLKVHTEAGQFPARRVFCPGKPGRGYVQRDELQLPV